MSKIEWTDVTWNPVTGCDKVSQGCKNCYAEVMHRRLRGMYPEKYNKPFLGGIEIHPKELKKPGSWKKPRKVFVNSMSDLFHKDVPFEFIRKVFQAMFQYKQHTYQVLTKRPDIMLKFFEWIKTSDNVIYEHYLNTTHIWLGTSCEDQKTADERIPYLLQVPAAIRFLSCEPLISSVSICQSVTVYMFHEYGSFQSTYFGDKIQWVICGGESGHKARPMHPDWVKRLRAECKTANVPFFFKQWGEYIPNRSLPDELTSNHKSIWLSDDSGTLTNPDLDTVMGRSMELMVNVGKHKSGNSLSGKQHLEFPTRIKISVAGKLH
jgi:protein gp37